MNKLLKGIGLLLVVVLILFKLLRNPDKSVDELKALYTNDQSKWVEINGMNVHYKAEGSGPPIILIHGTGAWLHTWDLWTELLDDEYTVYRMDLPAFGLTGPTPDGDYSMQMYFDFLEAFATSNQLDTFALAGNSLGGYIAWAYANQYPQKVSQLILLDAAGYPMERDSDALAFKLASNPILRPILKHITPKSFIKKNLEQVYSDDSKITDELITRYHDMALRKGNRQAFIDRVHTYHLDLSKNIKNISCPTLIMWGANDTWTKVSNAARFNQDIEDSRVIIYENVGHVPMEESPDMTAKDAMIFLAEN